LDALEPFRFASGQVGGRKGGLAENKRSQTQKAYQKQKRFFLEEVTVDVVCRDLLI
jgi:hypothetical protein